MSLNKKRLTVIGSGVAVAALAIGGVAFAAFNQVAQANPTGAGSEKFEALTVNGQWLGRDAGNQTYSPGTKLLLPGEAGDVKITFSNPGTNTVQGKVVSITPGATPTDGCTPSVEIASYSPGSALVLNKGTTVSVILKNAVKLKESATAACQGQSFPTAFDVKFEATRDPAANPQILTPAAVPPPNPAP
ncbi:hypothetical protein [Actinoplanes sp. NBRC 103695]|uniref:hypothetical protein n=1 Tax=Actinoplanes sp. NBRC 103695 TaxID=3032202 RepID=UPI0024A434C0|nr:hypothetical protein [Actinoplanes sp. NBRC 103695]GLZ01378.1 hypothetical protein Acsp02_86290 [Actinoplanes sp. NBRC 103695]